MLIIELKLCLTHMTNQTDLQAKSADNTEDSMETEARIAMEFPKHNWLVKNIMKEKKLKVRFLKFFMLPAS